MHRRFLTLTRTIALLMSLLSELSFAHGSAQLNESSWHKLEFWNGEFHLFAMIFWLAIVTALIASVIKRVNAIVARQKQATPKKPEND